jgi:hypothetical protein
VKSHDELIVVRSAQRRMVHCCTSSFRYKDFLVAPECEPHAGVPVLEQGESAKQKVLVEAAANDALDCNGAAALYSHSQGSDVAQEIYQCKALKKRHSL